MSVTRILAAAAALLALAPVPASAQFFFVSPKLADQPLTGDEPGFGLPGATKAENDAALVWNLRAALNVAALQCGFAPTLLTETNYNAMLRDHVVELKSSFDTLGKYFVRIKKSKPAGQTALDQYGTRIYSGYSTVGGQYTFCQTAHSIGRDAIFAERGQLLPVAQLRLRELRNSLLSHGDQLSGWAARPLNAARFAWLPRTDNKCWKKDSWQWKCGSPWPAGSTAVAAR